METTYQEVQGCTLRTKYRYIPLGTWLLKASPANVRNVCVSACTRNAPNLPCGFLKRRLTNTPGRYRLADGHLSSLYPPSPSLSSLGTTSMRLCCFPPASSSTSSGRLCTTPLLSVCRKSKVHLHILLLSKWTLNAPPHWYHFASLQEDEHLSMPHQNQRRCSRTHVQTLRRTVRRYDPLFSLSTKRVPVRT